MFAMDWEAQLSHSTKMCFKTNVLLMVTLRTETHIGFLIESSHHHKAFLSECFLFLFSKREMETFAMNGRALSFLVGR